MNAKPPKAKRAAAVLLVLVAAGCGGALRPRVGLKQHSADLVFGIPPLDEQSAPADFGVAGGDVGVIGGATTRARPQPAIRPGLKAQCPDAEFNEVGKGAGLTVEGRPKAGSYRWKLAGDRLIVGLGRYPLSKFHTRDVQDVRNLEGPDYEFTTVQPELGTSNLVRNTFEVRTGNSNAELNGVFLTRVVTIRQTSRGAEEGRPFRPQPAIKFLPLPVNLADTVTAGGVGTGVRETFQTVGVDPETLQTLEHRGHARSRERFDACGQMVDSIFVDGEQSYSGGEQDTNTVTVNYDYGVATQFGGLIVFEHLDSPCAMNDQGGCTNEPDIRYDTNIGQLEPSS